MMAVTKVGAGDVVPDRNVRSQAPALAITARSLAGRNRQIYELATGTSPAGKEPPATKRNPQGRLGHDHSGPPWGSSFLHPIAWYFGREAEADVEGERQLFNEIVSGNPAALPPWTIWVPPFDLLPSPLAAPRARLHLFFLAMTDAGTSDLTVHLASHATTHPSPREAVESFSLTTTETGFSKDELFLDVVPGYNVVLISFEGSDPSNKCIITGLTLGVRVKRSHT